MYQTKDIESLIVGYLAKHGIRAFADVPNPRPKWFVSVERTGGASGFLEDPEAACQCWQKSRYKAGQLAYQVAALLRGMCELDCVSKVSVSAISNFPDKDSPRYQVVADFCLTG
jgi:hypothetical protein